MKSGQIKLVLTLRPDDIDLAICLASRIVLDNSAYSFWRAHKGDVDPIKFLPWVNQYAFCKKIDWVLIPDKIDGTEADNRQRVIEWMDAPCQIKSVPVWHLNESFEYLDWLIQNFDTVALGSSGQWKTPGANIWWERMGDVMDVACDSSGRPRCKFHGLRMLSRKIFPKLPLHSADSTNAAVNSGDLKRFAGSTYFPATRGLRAAVIASTVESLDSTEVWAGAAQLGLAL